MKYCEICGAPLEDGAKKCSECGHKIKRQPFEKDKLFFCITVFIMIVSVILMAWSKMNPKKSAILTNESELIIEVGEEKTISLGIKNPPKHYVVSFESCPLVMADWINETVNNKIQLSMTGVLEGSQDFCVYLYDKYDPDRKIVAEEFIHVVVKNNSKTYLSTDIESINLLVGDSSVITVTINGTLPESYYLKSFATEAMDCSWGKWTNEYVCPITYIANQASEGKVKVSLYDTSDDKKGVYVCSAEIPFTIAE